jgi:hypothetical protein
MQKAKEYIKRSQDLQEEFPVELGWEPSEDLKLKINNLLHLELPDHITIGQAEILAGCIYNMISHPEDYLNQK